jgi:uncharacterized iron-regulated membrane protein
MSVSQIKWVMVLFPAIGLLIWIAFLFVALVLCGVIWAGCNAALWLMDVVPRLTRPSAGLNPPPKPAARLKQNPPQASSPWIVPRVADRPAAEAHAVSDVWPKWTASYKWYVDQEKSLWQEQFDALNRQRP